MQQTQQPGSGVSLTPRYDIFTYPSHDKGSCSEWRAMSRVTYSTARTSVWFIPPAITSLYTTLTRRLRPTFQVGNFIPDSFRCRWIWRYYCHDLEPFKETSRRLWESWACHLFDLGYLRAISEPTCPAKAQEGPHLLWLHRQGVHFRCLCSFSWENPSRNLGKFPA